MDLMQQQGLNDLCKSDGNSSKGDATCQVNDGLGSARLVWSEPGDQSAVRSVTDRPPRPALPCPALTVLKNVPSFQDDYQRNVYDWNTGVTSSWR